MKPRLGGPAACGKGHSDACGNDLTLFWDLRWRHETWSEPRRTCNSLPAKLQEKIPTEEPKPPDKNDEIVIPFSTVPWQSRVSDL